jgi:dolichyl-phosphate-mannose--protein O-mannosyl transferase
MSKRVAMGCVILIIVASAAVRFVNLGAFHDYVFDEHYYVHDAVALLHHGLAGPGWHTADQATQSHPLLGDETIALGVAVLGDNPWGWRATSALAGVALIALVYPLARRLLLRRPWAVAAAGLAACDTLLIVQSRVAMLDGFVALWTLLCVYCALRAARARQGKLWLILCGVVGGLAVSSKWSGALALVAALAVLILWRRRARHVPIAWLVLALVAVPGAIYVLTYVPYFAAGHSLGQWLDLQRFMATKGWTIHHPDSISSSPRRWFFDADPIRYRWGLGSGGFRGLVAIGNPLLWWGGAASLVVLALTAVWRRSRLLGLPVLLVACLYLPRLVTSRTTYLYYMAPVVPFLALALSRALVLARSRWAAGYVAATAVPLALWLPFVVGIPVSFAYYHAVMRLSSWR